MHMMLLSLALADTGGPSDEATPDAVEAVEDADPSDGEEEIVEEFDETSGTVQRRRVRRKPVEKKSRRTEGLAVAALLGLLLFSSVNRRKRAERKRPERRTPLSIAELGSSVFEAGRQADLFLYRDLFLNGGEAGRLLGREEAEKWLARRSNKRLTDSLAGLAVHCREGTYFAEARLQGDVLVLRTRDAEREYERPVATVKQVGTAWRLYELVDA